MTPANDQHSGSPAAQPEAQLFLTANGVLEDLNPPFEALWRAPRTKLIGLPVQAVEDGDLLPENVSWALGELYRDLQKDPEEQSLSRLASDGNQVYHLKAYRMVEEGETSGYQIRIDDITDAYENHYQDESSHHSRWQELEAENRELEAFAYSVAHDLRAPLRFIAKFAHLLMEQHGAGLSGQALIYAEQIREGSRQMAQLIEDLLEFSQVIGQSLDREPVDMGALAAQVYENLADEREGRPVDFTLGDLEPAFADPALLRQVFHNLLSNALKFSRNRAASEIEVSCAIVDDEAIYCVRDNGAGFDSDYREQIFNVFRRFHQPDEFEGTGIGLALVKRIVERHSGRIWAESEIDAGAAFYFTLAPE